jgi:hypothetical protein
MVNAVTSSRNLRVVLVLAAACAVLSAAATFAWEKKSQDADGIGTIQTSYSFDVTNKQKLMTFGEAAFTGTVLGVARTDEANSTTVWRVSVKNSFKGAAAPTILVRQLGYVDGGGRSHVAEDQPLLVAGAEYLMVTTRDATSGEYTLVSGPAASVRADSAAQQKVLVQAYSAAAGG